MLTESQVQQAIEEEFADQAVMGVGEAQLKLMGIGQKIIEAVKKMLGQVDVDVAVAAAKKYLDSVYSPTDPFGLMIKQMVWTMIEATIRSIFGKQAPWMPVDPKPVGPTPQIQ